MNYQVCWRNGGFPVWSAKFFYLREDALEHYNCMKPLYKEVKILKIGANK